jgi:uncharacterized membrane protein YccC
MPVNVASAAQPRPLGFAGLPASSWAFALRIWLALIITLYVSFWFELAAPAAAATAVAVQALPTRGQGLEKALYLLLATLIGVVASIAIAGLFSQTAGLLLAVFGISVGLCVYGTGVLDGNRAFAAAYCCITIALIAVQQIDSPQQVFLSAVERGAALAVGVIAAALVNDIFAAPDYHPVLHGRLAALHRQVMSYVESVVRGEASSARTAAGLLRDIAAMHPEITSLAAESSNGNARNAAARTAMVDIVGELFLARALAVLPTTAPLMDPSDPNNSRGLMTVCREWLRQELTRKNADVLGDLDALRTGDDPRHGWHAPLYRSRRIAAETGVRAALHFTLIAILLAIAGWPATEICLSFVAFIIGLSYIAPDARKFTLLAIVATPSACLLAGYLKYYVFNGMSWFPLLALGLAPIAIGLTLMIAVPKLSLFGRITLIFTLIVLAPANVQDYDPATYLVVSFCLCLAAVLTFAAHLLIPPVSNDRLFQRLLHEAHRDLSDLHVQRHPDAVPEEATFRDATRIERIMTASSASPSSGEAIDKAMYCFDRASALRRCNAELDRLKTGPLASAAAAVRRAFARRDRGAVLAAAEALHDTALRCGLPPEPACAVLALASVTFAPAPSAP